MSEKATKIILDKTYQYLGQSHQFQLISPTLSRFYDIRGKFLFDWEAITPEEQGAWQEIGDSEYNIRH